MNLTADCVGARSKPIEVTITPRQAMNYAAALGDNNTAYFDDTASNGIVAPPMLAVALTWPLSAAFDTHWADAAIPPELWRQQVHYNESIRWYRSMWPGDVLAVKGEILAVLHHHSGALVVLCYTASDRRGEIVFVEYITGLLRGVSLDREARSAGIPAPLAELPGITSGLWERPIRIDPLAAHRYDACTDIVFPIHTSLAFARAVGLPGTIYQGTATLGLALKEILDREAGGAPESLAEVHAGFRGMVFPGTTVILRVLGTLLENHVKTVYFEVETPTGARAVRNGRAVLRVAE